MKKVVAVLLTVMLLLTGCGGNPSADAIEKYGSDILKVYNVGEYIGEDVISNFEKELGIYG